MFSHEYKTSAWRDSIQTYAPTILIVAIVIGVIVSFSNLFTNMQFNIRMPRFNFFTPRNTKKFSNIEGYSEIPLTKLREIERQL